MFAPAETARRVGDCAGRRYLVVTTGFSCNNHCTFCAQGQLYRTRNDAQSADAAERLRQLLARSEPGRDSTVVIVGGEPTMHGALPALIAESYARGATRTHVQTNGRRLAYATYVRQLKDAGLDSVEISIAGPREDIHDYHTNVQGSFRQSITGIRNAKSAGIHVALTVVVTRSNYRHLVEAVEVALRSGVHSLHFAFAQSWGRAYANFPRVVPRIEACVPHIAAAGEFCRRAGIPLFVSGFPRCRLPEVGIDCLDAVEPMATRTEGPRAPCSDCGYRTTCPGISEAYRNRYSAAELVAIPAGKCEQSNRTFHLGSALPFVGVGHVERSGSGAQSQSRAKRINLYDSHRP